MNTISVNEFGDGDLWYATYEKLHAELKESPLTSMSQIIVTTVFTVAHELGYKLVKHE